MTATIAERHQLGTETDGRSVHRGDDRRGEGEHGPHQHPMEPGQLVAHRDAAAGHRSEQRHVAARGRTRDPRR